LDLSSSAELKVISIVNEKVGAEKTAIAVSLINLDGFFNCEIITVKGWISDE
jgi:hypothetical protein